MIVNQKMNNLPWAAPAIITTESGFQQLPVGTVLSPLEAAEIFGTSYEQTASYSVCVGHYARRHISEQEAIANGLTFIFDGTPCAKAGHIGPRKIRLNDERRGSECIECIRKRHKKR